MLYTQPLKNSLKQNTHLVEGCIGVRLYIFGEMGGIYTLINVFMRDVGNFCTLISPGMERGGKSG